MRPTAPAVRCTAAGTRPALRQASRLRLATALQFAFPEDFQMAKTLLDKVWEAHTVRELPSGQTQLFIGLHLIHEVTSPQAFQMLREQRLDGAVPRAHGRDGRPHHPDRHAGAARSPTSRPKA